MSYVSSDEIREAKQMDLLTYLQSYEPNELVKLTGDTYCTREHDSLKISNGKWHWFSQGIGGKTAVDYLIKVKGCSFPDAVRTVLGRAAVQPPYLCNPKQASGKKFILPEMTSSPYRVADYLVRRGIDYEIIDYCFLNGFLYETKQYHNAAFVGYDRAGKARYAALRGTSSAFKGEAQGSDKRFSFSIPGGSENSVVHLFEAAIDAMSYATLLKLTGRDWHKDSLLSLAGVYQTKGEYPVPLALEHYLSEHPEIKTILLHLDNDAVGRGSSGGIIRSLGERYRVLDCPAPSGKDVNDYLMQRVERCRRKEQVRC